MPDREVRYCTTEDGVRIAYAISGKGERWLVHTPNLLSAMLAFEPIPGRRTWNDGLEEHFRLVQYDPRGTGFSQRDVEDLSFEALVRDLESVVDAAGADRATVFGFIAGTFTAVWYAAAHPERVSHLALWLPPNLRPDTPQFRAGTQLALSDWENFTEFYAHQVFGWDRGEQSNAYAHSIRETVTQETWLRFMGGWVRSWGTRLDELYEPASRVRAPTLCMQRQGFEAFPRYAAPIAGATTRMFPGNSIVPYFDGGHDIVQATADFVGAPEVTRSGAPGRQPVAVQTVLFTDLVGHTEMMQRLGDDKGRDVLREHERITRETLKEHSGAEVKTMGDGFMASFGSVTKAVECAIALQRAFAKSNASSDEPLHVRVGLNAGEPIAEDNDLFGAMVILASRIAAQAGAAEILVPDTVRGLCSGKGFVFADRGEVALKGFEEAVRLYEVRWEALDPSLRSG